MSRRVVLVVVVLMGLGAAAGVGWYLWRKAHAPSPPEIAHEGVDPELADAIESARRQVMSDPYSAPAWGDLGKLLRAARIIPQAADCFAQAERLDPKNPRWPYLQGEAFRLTDVSAAVPPLERAAALAAHADEVAPHLRLAEVLLALGREGEAETHLRRALELEPSDPSVHYNLGVLALARDDLSESLAHLKRCEHSPFTRKKASIQLAAVYRRMGRADESEKYGRRADALPPDTNWLDPYLGDAPTVGRPARFKRAEQLEQQKDHRAAAEILDELARERPEYRVYVELARNLGILGDFAASDRALRSAIALEPDRFQAYHDRSRLLWMWAEKDGRTDSARARARYEEAAECAREAIARQPDDASAHISLGLCLRRLGKRPEALTAFGTAAEQSPDLAEAYLNLGETLAEDGQVAKARACLERAVQLASPDDPRPRAALAKLKKN
jgi:tetratricopeptide (TPR) repeat protein